MSLKEYKSKRDFRKTSEPKGKKQSSKSSKPIFVVQKHAARRLHYDFRLELDGVLKSWAVPKGPNLDPSVKALAVHVEDHPMDYADFEGVIPEDQYGGGTVMVWDEGTWKTDEDPLEQYEQGKLSFTLEGSKLKGAWTLVEMHGKRGEGGKNWLLIKQKDKSARENSKQLERKTKSAVTGRTMDEIADQADRVWSSESGSNGKAKTKIPTKKKSKPKKKKPPTARQLSKLPGAKKASLPKKFKPQLAKLVSEIPSGDRWLHELKFDGYRILAFVEGEEVRLITRNGNDWSERFPTIVQAISELPIDRAVFDGEVVSLDKNGRSDFQELQNLMKRKRDDRLVYYLFDAPHVEGYDLTGTSLEKRKEVLAEVVLSTYSKNDGLVRYSDHIVGQGKDVLAHACRHAMEGVISKLAESKYRQARSSSWLKTKCLKRQEFVIVGFTKPSGSRIGFGALLLGYYEKDKLQYAGRVGTGFSNDTLRQLHGELKGLERKTPPVENPPTGAEARGVTWVTPQLVGEVEFTEWTDDGMLRHPAFQGLREDKPPEQITREKATPTNRLEKEAEKNDANSSKSKRKKTSASSTRKAKQQSSSGSDTVAGVKITHPDRVVYPEQGLTKLELAQYYESIADWILPYLVNRPLTLVRCPQGRGSKCFYQKHLTESLPDVLRGVSIKEKNKKAQYVALDDLAGLISLVQMGVLEIHPWGSTADNLEHPDQLIFDLDPDEGISWDKMVEAARAVRDLLDEAGLESFVRTSGGKGLHVVVPLAAKDSWDDAKSFAKRVADQIVKHDPDHYIATASKAKRKGKIFIDYLRNSRGATAVASYSTRAREGAPVAVPVRWDELSKLDSAAHYTVANLNRRLGVMKKDPWSDFHKKRQRLP